MNSKITNVTIFGAAIVLLFTDLFRGMVLFWGLPSIQFYPWRVLAVDQLQDGYFPYWNPYNGAGAPLFANYQSAILYPPNWLYHLITSPYLMTVVSLGHLVWAAWGMWLFLSRLGIENFGRSIGILSFVLGGYMVGRVMSFPTVNALAWMPWMFWIIDRLWEESGWRNVGYCGFIFGMQLLAGHAQTTFYSSVAVGSYLAWRIFVSQELRLSRVLRIALGGSAGILIASWQLLFTAELLSQSQRSGGVSFDELTNISFAPLRLLTMVSPHFFGTPSDGSYLTPGRGVYFEEVAYIGFIPLISAFFAIREYFKRRKNPHDQPVYSSVPFWILLTTVGFFFAAGHWNPVFRFFYNNVPTFSTFRAPIRWLIFPAFALPALAAIGVHAWNFSNRRRYITRLLTLGGLVISVVALLYGVNSQVEAIPTLALALGVTGLLLSVTMILTLIKFQNLSDQQLVYWRIAVLVVVAIDLVYAGWKLNPGVPPEYFDKRQKTSNGRLYWSQEYLEETLFDDIFVSNDYTIAEQDWEKHRDTPFPNLNIVDGQQVFNNYDPLLIEHFKAYDELLGDTLNRSMSLLQVAGITEMYDGDSTITLDPMPLAWFVSDVQWADTDEEIINALKSPDWDASSTVILYGNENRTFQTSNAQVQILSEDTYNRRYLVDAKQSGILVMSYTHYPGWKVTVNGTEDTLYRANLNFQAVIVPEGSSEIRVFYEPTYETEGIVLSLAGLLICGILIWYPGFQKNIQARM